NNNNNRKRKSHPKAEAFTPHDIAEAGIPCICRLVEAISPFAPRCAPHFIRTQPQLNARSS
ncbi:hypothetical protein K525DRAFT_253815, partial [Schizophyllum commune Loenen D]